jgi:YD repeat-containing protein
LVSENHDGIVFRYSYDKDHKLISLTDPTDPSLPNRHFFYNEKGKLIKEECHKNDPAWFRYSLYYYNSGGKLDSIEEYFTYIQYSKPIHEWHYELKFGINNLPSEIRGNNWSGPTWSTFLEYDEKGNVIKLLGQDGTENRYEYDDRKSPYDPALFLKNPTNLSPNNITREYRKESGKPEELLLEYEYTYTPEGYPKTKIRHNRKFPQSDIIYTYEYQCN